MVKENAIQVKTSNVNGKTYKNISFDDMDDNGETIILTKVHDAVKRTPKKGTKFNPEKDWTMCQTTVKYKGEDVGLFLPRGYGIKDGKTAYIDNVEYSDAFDNAGKAGDSVRVTLTKGLGKNNKGKDIAVRNYAFEKVN